MAESTLSLSYDEIREVVGRDRGITGTPGNWTTDDSARVDQIIKDGLRTFYYPPPIEAGQLPHEWSFLKPVNQQITVWPDADAVNDGVPVLAAGKSTITATTAVFHPTMIGKILTYEAVAHSYAIVGYTSATAIVVAGDATVESADEAFVVTADGNYRLPDDFGVIDGMITFQAGASQRTAIQITGEQTIRRLRQCGTATGAPRIGAIIAAASDGSAGQRFELMLYPAPAAVYVLNYRYSVLAANLNSSNPYPLGGATHAQTILAAMKAAAENEYDKEVYGGRGPCMADFLSKLAASIGMDRRLDSGYIGHNVDRSDGPAGPLNRRRWANDNSLIVTYNGEPVA
jgi:hypothetical protein